MPTAHQNLPYVNPASRKPDFAIRKPDPVNRTPHFAICKPNREGLVFVVCMVVFTVGLVWPIVG